MALLRGNIPSNHHLVSSALILVALASRFGYCYAAEEEGPHGTATIAGAASMTDEHNADISTLSSEEETHGTAIDTSSIIDEHHADMSMSTLSSETGEGALEHGEDGGDHQDHHTNGHERLRSKYVRTSPPGHVFFG